MQEGGYFYVDLFESLDCCPRFTFNEIMANIAAIESFPELKS
jgi:hypothetical protein